ITSRCFYSKDEHERIYQYAHAPINYVDKEGRDIAIDPRISPALNGWASLHQEYPTYLHRDGSTEVTIANGDERFRFNVNSTIGGRRLSINNFSVGDDGM